MDKKSSDRVGMSTIKTNYLKWASKLKKQGKFTVRSVEDDNNIHVYIVKLKSKDARLIGKVFSIPLNKGAGKKLESVYTQVYEKANKISSEKSKFYRGCSLLVATKIFLDEVVLNKKKYLTTVEWIDSPSSAGDLELIRPAKGVFGSREIQQLLKFGELAQAYPFSGKKVYLPPAFKEVPFEFVEFKSLGAAKTKQNIANTSKRLQNKSPDKDNGKKFTGNTEKEPVQQQAFFRRYGEQDFEFVKEGIPHPMILIQKEILKLFYDEHQRTNLYRVPYAVLIDKVNPPSSWKEKFRDEVGKIILEFALTYEKGSRVLVLKVPIVNVVR